MTSRIEQHAVGVSRSASPKEFPQILRFALFVALSSFSHLTAAQSAEAFIAGLAPYERPVNAPKLREPAPDILRATVALRGVVEPVPPSVSQFLKDQGGWYTPFSWPGMHDYYDIRGWQAAPPPAGKS